MAKILIAEDDIPLGIALQTTLEDDTHTVELVEDGAEAYDRLRLYNYELVILDIDLPGLNGFEVCKRYRNERGKLPILMLTGKSSIADKSEGFESGADDYLTKPFNMKELLLRVKALLRRPHTLPDEEIPIRKFIWHSGARAISLDGEEVALTPRELELLEFFIKRPEKFFGVETLLNEIWASDSDVTEIAVRQCVSRLRKKLEIGGDEPIIVTSRGLGYKFSP